MENDLRARRGRAGWSQAELGRRAGLSRAEISAIETGRLVPSTAAALALARCLDCSVESLFRLPEREQAAWAWNSEPPFGSGRFWRAEVAGRVRLYPVEVSPLGLLPHDGTFGDQRLDFHPGDESLRTLVLASCDPAVGLLHAELARMAGIRLIGSCRDPAARALICCAAGWYMRRACTLQRPTAPEETLIVAAAALMRGRGRCVPFAMRDRLGGRHCV